MCVQRALRNVWNAELAYLQQKRSMNMNPKMVTQVQQELPPSDREGRKLGAPSHMRPLGMVEELDRTMAGSNLD